jgi:hypothetical protein
LKNMTKEEILIMLYRACCLFEGACKGTPDWIRIISGANPEMLKEVLEDVAEMARDDDTYADVVWEDGL